MEAEEFVSTVQDRMLMSNSNSGTVNNSVVEKSSEAF
jgi:hypothetical protein